MWLMMQQDGPDEFVLPTGEATSLRREMVETGLRLMRHEQGLGEI